MANQKLTFEVSAEAVNVDQVKKKIKSIDDEITKLQKHAKDIRVSDKGGSEIGKELIKGIEDSISELKSIQKNYTNILDSISNKKIDTKQFENFANTVNTRLEVVEQRVVSLEESLTKLVSRFEKKISTQVIEKQIASLRGEFDTFTSSAQEAIKILSNFESMVNATTSKPKETKIKVDTSELEKVEGLIKRFESDSFLGGKSGLTITTDSAVKNLNNLYEKYQSLSSELSKTKDPKQISSLQVQLAELLPELAQVTNRIIELKKLDINSLEDGSIGKISIGEIDDFAKIFDFIQNEIGITSNRLADMRNDMRGALSSVTEEATTEVSQFTFKKGGIRVPVTIDAKSQSSLETKYNELVSALQGYADLHPVNVTMRLFPLNTNRAGADEITSAMRNIQTDINSVQDEGLKTKLNSLYDDLEAQFKKALDLKIKVDLGDTQTSAKQRIKDLQEEIKAQGFTIYPTFDISEEEANKITDVLAKVQNGATLNFNDEFQKTADALNKLISNGNIGKWSDEFAEGLGKAYTKLEEMQPLIQTLTFFFATKKTAKDSIISKADITAVTNFANAINNLQEIIEKIQKVDLTKLDTEGFGEKLQAELGDMKPVIIPIEPDLNSITSFISKIEDALSKANINLKPSASSKTLRDYVQDDNIAKSMYLDMYKGLDAVADNVGTPLKKKIAESLVGGLRKGMSSVSDILREGLKGTKFEPITEQLIGDKETLDEIKNVANKISVEYQKALGESEVNVTNIIGNIESQILGSDKKVNIPIGVQDDSIDEFIGEIRSRVKDKKIELDVQLNAEKKSEIKSTTEDTNTNSFMGKTREELEQMLAIEEKWLARCKEGSNAYNTRKENIKEINTLLGNSSAQETTQSVEKAAEAIKEEGIAAKQAALLKQKFAEANKEVASSAEKTASETKNAAEGLKAEGKAGEENKDKLSESEINEMANKREQATAKRIQEEEKAARAQGNAINKEQERQYKEQQKLQEKARQEEEKARQEMEAALLKTQESRRKAEEKAFNAQSAAINKEQERQYNQQVKEQEQRNSQLANFKNGFTVKRNDIQFEIDKGGHTKEFETRLQDIISKIDAINAKSIDAVTEQDIKDAQALSEEIRIIQKSGKLTANKSANENSVQKTLSQINSILSGNTKLSFKQTDVYDDLITLQKAFQNFDTSRPQSELAELSTEFLRTKARFDELDDTVKGENFFQTVIGRLQKSNAQLIATYFSWMDMIRYARQAIDTIRDLDTQMVELAKVSEQSLDQIKGDFSSYSTVAKNLGATISDTISATADWARFNKIDPLYGNI